MAIKVLFVDRDGTINVDCPYCYKPADLKIYMDTVYLMKEYQQRGFRIIILTNQSGINRGYYTVKQMNDFNDEILRRLGEYGLHVDSIYYCPHRPDEGCSCRKPERGLIDRALADYDIDLRNSVVLGDRDDVDGEMARRVGINYIILNRNKMKLAE